MHREREREHARLVAEAEPHRRSSDGEHAEPDEPPRADAIGSEAGGELPERVRDEVAGVDPPGARRMSRLYAAPIVVFAIANGRRQR